MATMVNPAVEVKGRFGAYGGRYVPETLMAALEELEQAYAEAEADPAFHAETRCFSGVTVNFFARSDSAIVRNLANFWRTCSSCVAVTCDENCPIDIEMSPYVMI